MRLRIEKGLRGVAWEENVGRRRGGFNALRLRQQEGFDRRTLKVKVLRPVCCVQAPVGPSSVVPPFAGRRVDARVASPQSPILRWSKRQWVSF